MGEVVDIDGILSDPSTLDGVPVDEIANIAARCAAVLVVLQARTARVVEGGERMLTAEQVAGRVGMSLSWVKQNRADLPTPRSIGGRPRWLASEVDRWLLSRPRHGEQAGQGRRIDSTAARAVLDSLPGRRAAV